MCAGILPPQSSSGLDLDRKADKEQAKAAFNAWLKGGALAKQRRPARRRERRDFVIVGPEGKYMTAAPSNQRTARCGNVRQKSAAPHPSLDGAGAAGAAGFRSGKVQRQKRRWNEGLNP